MPTRNGSALQHGRVRRERGGYRGVDAIEHVNHMMAASPDFAEKVREAMEARELSVKIKAMRQRRHLTQSELAVRAGTRQPNIARIEQGSAVPKLELLTKIAHALGYRLDLRFVAEQRSA